MTFSPLGLVEPLLRAVAKEGYATPTPIQSQTIPHLLAGRDLLACAPTGTGKTAAFTLPILQRLITQPRTAPGPRKIRALVLSPTRELAAQIGDSVRTYAHFTNLRHAVVFGGVGYQPQIHALCRGTDLLIATPGRLLDLMNQGHVDFSSVEIVVLDEADRMLDMGFIPDIRRIIGNLPARRQSMLFSATMPEPIERLAHAMLKNPLQVTIQAPQADLRLIEESVCFVAQNEKARLLASILQGRDVNRAIVFTRTRHGADRVVRHLAKAGIRAESLHGDKTQAARLRTMANFRGDRTTVVVATDLAARGLDVDGISHVLNYDLPHEPETYVHRIGRTGRAGAAGIAVSFCDSEETKYLRSIERMLRRSIRIQKTAYSQPEPVVQQPIPARQHPSNQSDQTRFRKSWKNRSQRGSRKKREQLVASPDQWRR